MGALLERILDFENVKAAWEEVRKGGKAAGVDNVSARRFGRHWEERLRNLIADVRSNRYKPSKLRVVYIPKRSGGRRRLGIPTIRDRVLQRAVMQVLMTRYERKFLSCSYGYRPKRSVFHAVAAILKYKDRGFEWVLDADIDDCFDSLDHAFLWDLLEKDIPDNQVLDLLGLWLEIGAVHREKRKGVSQGMPISPLLSNVYLHELDWRLVRARWTLVRYADDFIVLTRSEQAAHQVYEIVERHLAAMKLRYEPNKTRITSFKKGFRFLGVEFDQKGYRYTWEGKHIEVTSGLGPLWELWDYFPHGYEA